MPNLALSTPLLDALYLQMDLMPNRAAMRLETAFVDLIDQKPSVARNDALTALCRPYPGLLSAVYLELELSAPVVDLPLRGIPIYALETLVRNDDRTALVM